MANHCKVFRRGDHITIDEFIDAFRKINKKYFENLLNYKKDKDEDFFIILPDKSGYEGICIEIEEAIYDYHEDENGEYVPHEIGGSHIDIRHGHGNDFYWWLDTTLTKLLTLELNAEYIDDGVYEYINVDNMSKIYYTFSEYMKNKYTSIDDKNLFYQESYDDSYKRISLLERNLDDKVYHNLVTEKYKKRKEGVDKILEDEK